MGNFPIHKDGIRTKDRPGGLPKISRLDFTKTPRVCSTLHGRHPDQKPNPGRKPKAYLQYLQHVASARKRYQQRKERKTQANNHLRRIAHFPKGNQIVNRLEKIWGVESTPKQKNEIVNSGVRQLLPRLCPEPSRTPRSNLRGRPINELFRLCN